MSGASLWGVNSNSLRKPSRIQSHSGQPEGPLDLVGSRAGAVTR